MAREFGLTHPILVGGAQVAQDRYEVTAIPTTFWIGPDGTILAHDRGFGPGEEKELRERTLALLDEHLPAGR